MLAGQLGAAAAPLSTKPLQVMVVDDSMVMRGLIARMINEHPNLAQVVASVSNGQLAVERAQRRDLDVVVLDVEMPVMDGLAALPQLMAIDPNLVVIMASSLTTRNAQISLKALSAGAKDYVPKPSATGFGLDSSEFKRDLIEKIRTLGQRFRRVHRPQSPNLAPSVSPVTPPASGGLRLRPVASGRPSALAIGSSTGGPNALARVLKDLPRPLRVPVFVTQHMPPTFTAMLAENLTRETLLPCAEARDGEPVLPGRVYIAPGDFHMTPSAEDGRTIIRLHQGPKENFCRPAVDPMLRALVGIYQRNLLAAILTGMGQDGLLGAEAVVKAGGNIVAQDEASSVVWGMPGAVARAGVCCAIAPLDELGHRLGTLMGV